MAQRLMKLWKDEQAPTAVEYAIMAGLIAVVIVVAVAMIGTTLAGTFNNVASLIPGAGG
jgi:pilus assembly protein Flp/PilA